MNEEQADVLIGILSEIKEAIDKQNKIFNDLLEGES